jgi:hypothetical protein
MSWYHFPHKPLAYGSIPSSFSLVLLSPPLSAMLMPVTRTVSMVIIVSVGTMENVVKET